MQEAVRRARLQASLGDVLVHDLDGDFAMLIAPKPWSFCCILKGIILPRYLYTKPKDPES